MIDMSELHVKDLRISFRTGNGRVQAVRGINFDLGEGETLAIVGESGSGKSVTSKAILGILEGNATVEGGEILYNGRNILELSESEWNRLRGDRVAMVFQDPMSSLDPIVRVGRQLTEAMLLKARARRRENRRLLRRALAILRRAVVSSAPAGAGSAVRRRCHAFAAAVSRHPSTQPSPEFLADIARALPRLSDELRERLGGDCPALPDAVAVTDFLRARAAAGRERVSAARARARALQLMEEVGIPHPDRRFRQYPFEFSGGMRQRIVIAIALSADPDVLICDEPTTALDVTIQSQILELINRLKRERRLSVIFITHDLGVVANMADRIAVMYAGKIVETGTAEDIFYRAAHPYTWALLTSMPDPDTDGRLDAIPGTPPDMTRPPVGDAFAARNRYAMAIDFEQEPPMFRISDTHAAATWLLHPDAPRVSPPAAVTERIARMRARAGETENEEGEKA